MKMSSIKTVLFSALLIPLACWAQVNSGSNGSDGAFNPTTNTVINMADHPNGIYQYTSVNIPSDVTVTFIPNTDNAPVTWLVQSNVAISGTVDVSGYPQGYGSGPPAPPFAGGPGGWRGGSGGTQPTPGEGPGGGSASVYDAGSGSFGSQGTSGVAPGPTYGNIFLLPLLGGSGGGGSGGGAGGAGGGGAILIVASSTVQLNGGIISKGGNYYYSSGFYSGVGSGGGVRVVTQTFGGTGSIDVRGGNGKPGAGGGNGRIRIDAFQRAFSGNLLGVVSQGFQPIIFPTDTQAAQLNITSAGGVPVSDSPTGQLAIPDAVLSAQLNNPIPVVVQCANLPLNTQITVSVKPANGATISAVGYNNAGTVSNSTATIMINIPRGGGLIYATAAFSN